MPRFVYRTFVPSHRSQVFDWHTRPGAFERLSPPWERVRVLARSGGLEPGGTINLKVGPWGLIDWQLVHGHYEAGHVFTDEQRSGPFRFWRHTHRFLDHPEGCEIEDIIDYEMPRSCAFLGRLVESKLKKLFIYRKYVLNQEARWPGFEPASKIRRIGVTGSSGLIGSALVALLRLQGHTVIRLVRRRSALKVDERYYNTHDLKTVMAALEGLDTVVHLAGESIAGWWSNVKKKHIFDSRVNSTRAIKEAIAAMANPPHSWVVASGLGYYGNTDSCVDEKASHGQGFLAETAAAWEGEALVPRGTRVVLMRTSTVLSGAGGLLKFLLPAFKLGFGPIFGSGQQAFSWVSLGDAARAYLWAISEESLQGPINLNTPQVITQADFAKTLGYVLGKPVWLRIPERCLNACNKFMAESLFLSNTAAKPSKLLESGFCFQDVDLADTLCQQCGTL